MADRIQSRVPYNDRFNPEDNYNQILFNPDLPLQQAELVELQSILNYNLGSLGDVLMVDGDIVEGMDYHMSEDGSEITIHDGQIYLDGKVRTFNEETISFVSEGTFIVGVDLSEEIVTAEEDESLLDQTSGVKSYYSPGADRLKETVFLTGGEEVGVPILEFRDGDLFISNPGNRELSRLNDILAERTYDESGSYRVRGFEFYSEQHPSKQNSLNVVVEPGRAYVMGYQVDKPTPTRIEVEKARDMNEVNSEAFYYDNRTRRGKLGNSPVSDVHRVTGQVQVTKESVGRGATADSTDALANSSVTNVLKVWREENGAEVASYRQGTDFQLVNGNQIDWSPGGNEPQAGGTYFVTYTYNKTMELDVDYKVVTEGSVDDLSTFIDFNGMPGNKPVLNSMVLVDYDYYLAREDLIVIDREGEIHIQEGQPDSLTRVKKPNSQDPYMLILGSIVIYPNSTTSVSHKSSVTNLSMVDLQNMYNRIRNLEYNDAVNALDQPAMDGVSPVVLRGVFSDGFISMEKYDTGHPDATIGFSFEDAEITLPYASADKKRPQFLENSSNAHTWGRLVTAPFDEELAISQPNVSDTININPYHVFNAMGVLTLDPSEDNWIEEERVTVVDEETDTLDVRRWWGSHANDPWVEDELEMISNIKLDPGYDWKDSNSAINGSWTHEAAYTGTMLEDGGTRVNESKIEFMRQIDINFEAKNLRPNENNLVINFDGHIAPITPASGFTAGSDAGSIRSNAQGVARGTFTIPSGVRTGVREVALENMDNSAVTTFVAEGTHKRVEDVIVRTRVTINMVDPLAQSFQFRQNQVLSSIDVFFASKDTDKNVNVQIRGITPGGMPNKTIHAETLLEPSQVNVSDDASVPTNITFDDPLMVDAGKEYALVLLTDSDLYTVWIATRGQEDLSTGERITANPYITGVMYSSSNASAWTIHQDSDMKFNIYTANFNETAVLEFDTMEDISADALVLMATYLTPDNTGCLWDVKLVMNNEPQNITVNDKQWEPLANYEEIELNQLAREVKLRATFRANKYMSPMMSLNDLLLTTFLSELSGSYVSRTIDASDAPYNTLRMSFQAFEPANSSVTPQFSTDGGNTWREFTVAPEAAQQSNEFIQYTYMEKLTDDINGHDTLKVRLNLRTQNSFQRPRVKQLMSTFTFE